MINGDVSWWWRDLGGTPPLRASLSGDLAVDVCIVGAGYTGLWTAYYLKRAQPDLRICIVEQRFAGFGASGRNGGWLTNSVTGGRAQYVARHGRDAAIAQQRALNDTVDEVIEVARREGIGADIVKGGELEIARTPAQLARLRTTAAEELSWPHTDVTELDAAATRDRVEVAGVLGGLWHPHCARIHPAKLAAGLADTVERSGVTIVENTTARSIEPGRVETDRGTVRADAVIRATEGFTANLRGEHRTWLPMNSSMIVTEPLPSGVWDTIGWAGRDTRAAHRGRSHRVRRQRGSVSLRVSRRHGWSDAGAHDPFARGSLARLLPRDARCTSRPRVGGRPRCAARLVSDRRFRPRNRARVGRRLRRDGSNGDEPRGTDPG